MVPRVLQLTSCPSCPRARSWSGWIFACGCCHRQPEHCDLHLLGPQISPPPHLHPQREPPGEGGGRGAVVQRGRGLEDGGRVEEVRPLLQEHGGGDQGQGGGQGGEEGEQQHGAGRITTCWDKILITLISR